MKNIEKSNKQINDILTTEYTIHNGQLYKKSKTHLLLINGERKERIFVSSDNKWFSENNINLLRNRDKAEFKEICDLCGGTGEEEIPFLEGFDKCTKCEGRGYLN